MKQIEEIMKLGAVVLLALSGTLMSCGGGGGQKSSSGSSSEEGSVSIQECQIMMSTINLAHGVSCNLTQADADLFGLTPGLVQCDNGVLNYEGNEFSSGSNSINLNGLSFVCSVNG